MENLPEITKKQNAFASYALESHNILSTLQTRAAKVISDLSDIPTTIEQISEAEIILKASKSENNAIKTDRLAQTSKLDKFFENFMAPEKAVMAAIPLYEQAIIKLKNDKATSDRIEANKQVELKHLKESFLTHINNTKADHESFIAEYVNKCFSFAIKNAKDDSNIGEYTLVSYILKCCGTKKAVDFEINMPKTVSQHYNVFEIWEEVSSKNPYLDGLLMMGKFEGDIKDKFKYFSIALKDKEKALAFSESQANDAKQQADDEAERQNIGAKLSVTASVLDDVPSFKPLNEKFEIDVESSEKNALAVMIAFATNIDKCRSKVKADWMKLSINQMGSALASIKNDDNKFEVSGIKFKVIQKL